MEADLSKDKVQCTGTATAVWLRGTITEQGTLDAIEQLFLELIEFMLSHIDPLELVNK